MKKISFVVPFASKEAKKKYLLQDFLVDHENEFAYNVLINLVSKNAILYNPIVLYGKSGVGKTHLIYSVYREIQNKCSSEECLLISSMDFHKKFFITVQDKNYGEFRRQYHSLKYFFLEDVHFLEGKKKTQEELFRIVTTLITHQCQIIVTSNQILQKTKLIPSLVTSLSGGLQLRIEPLSFERVQEYCNTIAQFYGVQLNRDALRIIWQHFSAFAPFKQTFQKIMFFLQRSRKRLDLSTVESFIYMEKSHTDDMPTKEDIINLVCMYYKILPATIDCPVANRKNLTPKYIILALAQKILGCTISELQHFLEFRSENSVRYALHKVRSDPKLNKVYSLLYHDLTE